MDDECLRNTRTQSLQAGERIAGQLGDEERVENISRKSCCDHERGPLHSTGRPANCRGSTLDQLCGQTASVWHGPRYGASWEVILRDRVLPLNRHGQNFSQGWRVVIRLLVWVCVFIFRMQAREWVVFPT
jgi:hypothetical protein